MVEIVDERLQMILIKAGTKLPIGIAIRSVIEICPKCGKEQKSICSNCKEKTEKRIFMEREFFI